MRRFIKSAGLVFAGLFWLGSTALVGPAWAEEEEAMAEAAQQKCIADLHIDPKASDAKNWKEPKAGSCKVVIRGVHRFPDKRCTPGALNPTVTEKVLRSPEFKTPCIRNQATTEEEKKKIFVWYGVKEDATCEMDHFVSLEIGGADTLDNIWPQCGPPGSTGEKVDFRQKDKIEDFLGKQVKSGAMTQKTARQKISSDWTKAGPAQ